MKRQEFESHLLDLQQLLEQQIAFHLEISVSKLCSQSVDILVPLMTEFQLTSNKRSELEMNMFQKISQFLVNTQKHQKIMQGLPQIPRRVSELFSNSFYPTDLPVLDRHPYLKSLVEQLNDVVGEFYKSVKAQFNILVEEEKKLDFQEEQERILKERQRIADEIRERKRQEEINLREQMKIENEKIVASEQEKKKQVIKSQEPDVIIDLEQIPDPIMSNIINNTMQQTQIKPKDFLKEVKASLETLSRFRAPNEFELKCEYCICKSGNTILNQNQKLIRCSMCTNYFHMECLRLNNQINNLAFVCPECILPRLDPLHELVVVLNEPIIYHPQYASQFKTLIFSPKQVPNCHQIELRCLRIDGSNQDITFPDIGEIVLNGKRILELKPLQSNSSLKKRKDDKLQLTDYIQNAQNHLVIREGQPTSDQKQLYRINLQQHYLLGLFQVQVYSVESLVKKLKASDHNWIGIRQCKQQICLNILQGSNEFVEMHSIKVSLQCTFDCSLIITPVRGALCEHVQCFSLENICVMMKSVTPRKWNCPICKAIILELQIDSYQLAILSLIRQYDLKLTEISFDDNADIEQYELQQLLSEQFIESLPENTKSNKNRIIPIEILSQKLLKYKPIYDLNSYDVVDLDLQEPGIYKKIKGQQQQPIEID